MSNTNIYGLFCPITKEVKYIGSTVCSLEYRLRKHIEESVRKNKSLKNKWIKELHSKGLKPEIVSIDIVNSSNSLFWESHYIYLFKTFGFNLTNSNSGGSGGKMISEVLKRISESKKGKTTSDRQKEAVRRIAIGNKFAAGNSNRSVKVICENVITGGSIDFPSIRESAEALGLGSTTINNNLSGLNKLVSKRFKFRYANS